MRALLAVVALAVGVLGPAQAASAQEIVLLKVIQAYTEHVSVIQTIAKQSTVRKAVVAAYGEGSTTCTLSVTKQIRPGTGWTWDFEGATDCSVPVEQTGQAAMTGESTITAPLCSGVRASCRSAGSGTGFSYTGVEYRVMLRAPRGQGWIASPEQCSGAGTDLLTCTF